jgi:hypothetical protein
MGSLVRTLNDHLKSKPEPPDLRPSSNVDFPVAWNTGPATDPSLTQVRFSTEQSTLVTYLWIFTPNLAVCTLCAAVWLSVSGV